MEFLELGRSTDQGQLGRQLAQMHLAAPKVRLRSVSQGVISPLCL